jgi:hypothetical protein
VVLQGVQHFRHDLLVRDVPAFNREVGFLIDRIALLHQLAHGQLRVGGAQQWAGIPLSHTLHEDGKIGFQPDRNTAGLDPGSRLGVDERPAASCKHLRTIAEQPGDHAPLAIPEIGFAVIVEDFADALAGGDFDLVVDIDEWQAKPRCHAAADR